MEVQQFKIDQFKQMVQELLAEGFGEVNLKVVIKGSKVEYISLTKIVTSKLT